jgi:dolichol-phosphate mannosyltransferase
MLYLKGKFMEPLIIIPTFNERENIVSLLKTVRKTIPKAYITVVDDNSPDGTASQIKPLTIKDKKIKLIVRKGKGGRGSAVVRGFKDGIKNKNIDLFIEMDSDFSHNPKELIKILMNAKKHDVLIASRYLKSSKIINWPLKRRIFSRLANIFARSVLWVPIADYTNGFRCYSRKVLEGIGLSRIKETGYAVLMEMIYLVNKRGFKIKQLSTVFVNRKKGQSNTSIKEILNAFSAPFRIRRNHWND